MRSLALMVGLIGAAILPHECGAQIFDNPFAEYFERGISISPGGANANDTNAAIQTIDPWPRYAGHTRIPDDGKRAALAIQRMYIRPNPFFGQQQGAGTSSLSMGAAGGGTPGSFGTGGGGSTGFDTGAGTAAGGGGASTGLQPVPAVPSGY